MAKKKSITLAQALPWILIIGGVIGLICSFVLTYDQIRIWQDPSYHPACNLNPVVSCGSVINSKQGDIFGIPGPFFGLAVFPVLVTLGVIVASGTKLKRWIWQGLQLGVIGGLLWALLLFYLSIYRVHALCPFCLTVDAVIYILVWYVTLYNIEAKNIPIPKGWAERAATFARKHHLDIIVFWFLLVIAFILKHFWYYYGQHL
jgi:uncharacterized membrane protein